LICRRVCGQGLGDFFVGGGLGEKKSDKGEEISSKFQIISNEEEIVNFWNVLVKDCVIVGILGIF